MKQIHQPSAMLLKFSMPFLASCRNLPSQCISHCSSQSHNGFSEQPVRCRRIRPLSPGGALYGFLTLSRLRTCAEHPQCWTQFLSP